MHGCGEDGRSDETDDASEVMTPPASQQPASGTVMGYSPQVAVGVPVQIGNSGYIHSIPGTQSTRGSGGYQSNAQTPPPPGATYGFPVERPQATSIRPAPEAQPGCCVLQ